MTVLTAGSVGYFLKNWEVYYRGRQLTKLKGRGVHGNFVDVASGEEFWVSGVKKRGSNAHPAERGIVVIVDDDAQVEYQAIRSPQGA